MSNEKSVEKQAVEAGVVEKTSAPAPVFSSEDLIKLVVQLQKDNIAAQLALKDALLESRKPYVDPKVLEARKREGEERLKVINQEAANRAARRTGCPHVREDGTPNIKWMQHSNDIIKGTCGTCIAEFDTRIPADRALLARDLKAQKNMGRAGGHARRNANAF